VDVGGSTEGADGVARREKTVAMLGAVVAVSMWGSSAVVVKLIDLSSTEIAVYRFAIYGAVMVGVLAVRGAPLTLRALRLGFWGGLALALDVALFFEAAKRTTIVNATVIGTLQPVAVSIYASRVERERIGTTNVVLGSVAVVAAISVVIGSSAAPAWNPVGDLLAFGALFAWSGYFILSKRSQDRLTPGEYTAATAIITGGVNLLIGLLIGTSFGPPDGVDWFWLLFLSLSAGLLGHSLMNWSLVRIPLWIGSTTTLFIPVSSAALAWLVLDESLTGVQIAAMVVTIASVAEILRRQSHPAPALGPATATGPPAGGGHRRRHRVTARASARSLRPRRSPRARG
jgi:drug/metabolite transporter (DMT)-like permease